MKVVEGLLVGLREQLRELRRSRFDVALDLQGLLKSAAIAKLSGAKTRFGFDKANLREPASRIFLNRTVEIEPRTHVIRKNLALAAQALDIQVPAAEFEFPITTLPEHRSEADELIVGSGPDFALSTRPAGG